MIIPSHLMRNMACDLLAASVYQEWHNISLRTSDVLMASTMARVAVMYPLVIVRGKSWHVVFTIICHALT